MRPQKAQQLLSTMQLSTLAVPVDSPLFRALHAPPSPSRGTNGTPMPHLNLSLEDPEIPADAAPSAAARFGDDYATDAAFSSLPTAVTTRIERSVARLLRMPPPQRPTGGTGPGPSPQAPRQDSPPLYTPIITIYGLM